MKQIDATNFRKNLSGSLDLVNHDREVLLITRQNGENGVLMSEEDFNSFEEMRHLTSSINNIQAINEGITQLNNGEGSEMTLDELRDL